MTNDIDKLMDELDELEQRDSKETSIVKLDTANKNSSNKQDPIDNSINELEEVKFKLMGARLHPDLHRHLKSLIGLEGLKIQEYHCKFYEELLKKHGVEQSIIDLLKLPIPASKNS